MSAGDLGRALEEEATRLAYGPPRLRWVGRLAALLPDGFRLRLALHLLPRAGLIEILCGPAALSMADSALPVEP